MTSRSTSTPTDQAEPLPGTHRRAYTGQVFSDWKALADRAVTALERIAVALEGMRDQHARATDQVVESREGIRLD